MPIRVLPLALQREIAAGEVITRPNDVVKELLENALDAGATRIDVTLQRGGIGLIQIQDNGAGIAAEELPQAVLRFATSKLEGGLHEIATLGFRGEALWSIAFAAQLTITSRPQTQLGAAQIVLPQGAPDQASTTRLSAPAGTTVAVRDLFAHLPARKASLESPALELRRIIALVSRFALHHPHVAWRVTADQEPRFVHAPGTTRDALGTVYGAMTANRVLAFAGEDGTPPNTLRVHGVISRPELSRVRRDRLHLAVNGRPIEIEDTLARAVLRAYEGLLPKNHWPVGVIELHIPPQFLNVNTHPAKWRVALLESERSENLLTQALRETLATHPLVRPAPEPRAVSGPVFATRHAFPPLHFLGTYRNTYLLAEGNDDLWVLDQHAAHERIIYEELEDRFDTGQTLELVTPELLQLTPNEIAQLQARDAELRAFGLTLEPFGADRYRVRTIPTAIAALPIANSVAELVAEALGPQEAKRAVLSRFACHPAVKAGHVLSPNDAQGLLNALQRCRVPWACPHGRPTALRLTERDLAHQFGRRGVRDVERASDSRDLTKDEG